MLSKPRLLKKLIISSALQKALCPSLSIFSSHHNSRQPLSSYKISSQAFSSLQFPKNSSIDLLNGLSKEQLMNANETLSQYSISQDHNPEKIQSIISLLRLFASIFNQQPKDLKKKLSTFEEQERVFKLLNIHNTYDVANNHLLKASISLKLEDPSIDIEYHLNEADRICDYLEDIEHEPEMVKGLMIESLLTRGHFHKSRNEIEKALEFYHEAFEKPEDDFYFVLPKYLIYAYREIGGIYASRKEIDKAVEFWTKGLDIAIQESREHSHDAVLLYCDLAELLFENQRSQEGIENIKKGLQIALKIYPLQ